MLLRFHSRLMTPWVILPFPFFYSIILFIIIGIKLDEFQNLNYWFNVSTTNKLIVIFSYISLLIIIALFIALTYFINLRSTKARENFFENFFQPSAEKKIKGYSRVKIILFASIIILFTFLVIDSFSIFSDSTNKTNTNPSNTTRTLSFYNKNKFCQYNTNNFSNYYKS